MTQTNRTNTALDEAEQSGLIMTELRAALEHEIAERYHDTPHSALEGSPVDAWIKAVKRSGPVRTWPLEATAQLRLKHLRLIDGGTRKREHGHYRVNKRNYIPFRSGMPKHVRVLYDPLRPELIALYSAEDDRNAGTYLGDAYATGVIHTFRAPSLDPEDDETDARPTQVSKPRKKGGLKAAAKRQRARDVAADSPPITPPRPQPRAATPLVLPRRGEFVA